MKDIAIDPETVCLWLGDHSFDRAIKTLCCLIANGDFNEFLSALASIECILFITMRFYSI